MSDTPLTPDALARLFHEAYERLAPDFGYKTRDASAVDWENVPADNKALMIATADAVLAAVSPAVRAINGDTTERGETT